MSMNNFQGNAPLISVQKNPSMTEAVSTIQGALCKHDVVLIVGCCKVDYDGRASSTLDWGNRFLLVKADGSVLVHRPTGYEPVNWQPSGCIFQVEITDKSELRVKATRKQPREVINIFFDKVYLLSVLGITDEGEFALHVSELDMKKAFLANPALVEEDFKPLSYEKNWGESGFIDIFGVDSKGNFVIVEIKRVPAGKEAVLQLERYMREVKGNVNRPLRGLIVAPALRRDVQPLLVRLGLEYKPVSLKRCFEILRSLRVKKI
ncbi:MAG: endonuclease NucS, partial [Candidatus Bathyarchaeota archaeon]